MHNDNYLTYQILLDKIEHKISNYWVPVSPLVAWLASDLIVEQYSGLYLMYSKFYSTSMSTLSYQSSNYSGFTVVYHMTLSLRVK